jgi:hypothetical protein
LIFNCKFTLFLFIIDYTNNLFYSEHGTRDHNV